MSTAPQENEKRSPQADADMIAAEDDPVSFTPSQSEWQTETNLRLG